MAETNHFIWIKFYTTFADALLKFKDDREALIRKLQETYTRIGMNPPKLENGGVPTDIDPFTIYGLFNKGLTDENRKRIIQGLIAEFDIDADAPESFSGIPVVIPMLATFYRLDDSRGEHDIEHLWDVYEAALVLDSDDNQKNRDAFCSAFDQVLTQHPVKWNITMGLYWIRPYRYLNLDSINRQFMSNPDNMESNLAAEVSKMKKDVPSGSEYLNLCDRVTNILSAGTYSYTNFPELSYQAWIVSKQGKEEPVKPADGKFELTITADKITSTDDRFTIDDLGLGDNYKPLDTYFKNEKGQLIYRHYSKNERKNSNQTLPRLACQIFEDQLTAMPIEERENFPICKYSPDNDMIRGIYFSLEEYQKHFNTTWEYLTYTGGNGKTIVLYCWNIFSTIIFVQECLKRFGKPREEFVLVYKEKEKKESEEESPESLQNDKVEYISPYSTLLLESRNIIFHGAPGTGKTYLAKQIAADIISGGQTSDITQLTDEQKKQVGFVQFHPSYDYTDFVEGMRPKVNGDGSMGFELQDGIFKSFVDRARKNYENSQKSKDSVEHELSAQEAMSGFFSDIEFGTDSFKTLHGSEFYITGVDDKYIDISIPANPTIKALRLGISELKRMLESDTDFRQIKDVASFFGKDYATQAYSYDYVLYKAIKARKAKASHAPVKQENLKNYVFIIDEINRGEISKIFGELFFSIDPGYRGRSGEVSTQYANMHADPDEKFYIPENVYIIGTMNDIDRSVDSFDFAMRRRFRFIELKADEETDMLKALDDEALEYEALRRMQALNQEIAETEWLNENYQVGASYFLKLNTIDFDQLWTDYLCPLLQEYIRGMYDEKEIMERFEKAYKTGEVNTDDASADQG